MTSHDLREFEGQEGISQENGIEGKEGIDCPDTLSLSFKFDPVGAAAHATRFMPYLSAFPLFLAPGNNNNNDNDGICSSAAVSSTNAV